MSRGAPPTVRHSKQIWNRVKSPTGNPTRVFSDPVLSHSTRTINALNQCTFSIW